jgi:hypothetical protein
MITTRPGFIGIWEGSHSARHIDTAASTFVLFNTAGTKLKGFTNHAKIVKSKPA